MRPRSTAGKRGGLPKSEIHMVPLVPMVPISLSPHISWVSALSTRNRAWFQHGFHRFQAYRATLVQV